MSTTLKSTTLPNLALVPIYFESARWIWFDLFYDSFEKKEDGEEEGEEGPVCNGPFDCLFLNLHLYLKSYLPASRWI